MQPREAGARMRRLTQQEVDLICKKHDRLWTSLPGGARASFAWCDLSGLNLAGRNLSDADFTGAWRYLHRNNLTPVAQQAAATLKAPVIVPYMRNAAAVSAALNPFAADAAGILNAVMAACLRIARPGDLGVAKVSSLSLSSYSAGMDYLLASLPHLRATGAVREIIDLDSGFIVGSGKRLLPGSAARIVVISQVARPPLFPGTFIRDARWWGLPNDMGGMFETHQRILYEALYPALTRSIL